MSSLARLGPPLAVALAAGLAAPALRADDDDPRERARAEVERFRERLVEANRREVEVGGLKVRVVPLPDYFVYLAATDYLDRSLHHRSADEVRERFARLAEERDETVGVPGLLLRFVHEGARDNDFYALTGQLDDHLRVRALRACRMRGVASTGRLESKAMTLFKASRSGAFTGNVPPVIKRTYAAFTATPFTADLVFRRPFSQKAEELEVQVGNVIHFSGSGIRGNQADFEHGASAAYVGTPELTFALPLEAPEPPAVLAEALPAR